MGIRVRKVLGYALSDVVENDERFFTLGYLHSNCDEQEDVWTREGFLNYLGSNWDWGRFFVSGIDSNWESYDSVVYDIEFGLSNVLMIVPPDAVGRWFRRDDTIDYYEETVNYGQEDRIQVFDRPLYPHDFWIDKRDGRRLKEPEISFLLHYKNLKKEVGVREDTGDLAAERLGFTSYVDFLVNAHPGVPETVIALCRYLNLFVDENTAYRLQPAVYTYWS